MSTPLNDPTAITVRSFAIIRQELERLGLAWAGPEAAVVERIIHSTADFDFATITHFAPGAVQAGAAALGRGCPVVTDVNMVRAGISESRLQALGGSLHCFVADPACATRARASGITRSAAGIRLAWEQGLVDKGLVVIGNAPTALYEIIRLVEQEQACPALVIGVPVGFVSTAESKEALTRLRQVPWIVTQGRKGGSPVAVAIVNALLRLAANVPATETD
ncbi:precorrin-8X methylmutase [Litorilinea aerophila]|uniref:Precorrin-8X methylmutase n=1 Tax=Litorilinea aerophila TaxID=1204385 RepID=A0A540VJW5_9CHLR|nr:precorrin-8X methylmutase [Litorilinea aerophila]MCC9075557.1 precorrin-8X methylmutase [Litorilinea aerophila]GIV76461.1 MAG: precorrin-8X methylmutase [Litorilinea sp.]GIV76465.1 MAG: precorrin-8X methylmutase [Litorilinea sp.]